MNNRVSYCASQRVCVWIVEVEKGKWEVLSEKRNEEIDWDDKEEVKGTCLDQMYICMSCSCSNAAL